MFRCGLTACTLNSCIFRADIPTRLERVLLRAVATCLDKSPPILWGFRLISLVVIFVWELLRRVQNEFQSGYSTSCSFSVPWVHSSKFNYTWFYYNIPSFSQGIHQRVCASAHWSELRSRSFEHFSLCEPLTLITKSLKVCTNRPFSPR